MILSYVFPMPVKHLNDSIYRSSDLTTALFGWKVFFENPRSLPELRAEG